jgi:hypothetical protein
MLSKLIEKARWCIAMKALHIWYDLIYPKGYMDSVLKNKELDDKEAH